MKVETNAKHPEMSVYMVIKEDQGSEGEKTCGIWTNDIESMNVTRFKESLNHLKGSLHQDGNDGNRHKRSQPNRYILRIVESAAIKMGLLRENRLYSE